MSDEFSQNDKALVVTREVGSHQFGQRVGDGYFNATAMCKAAGKLSGDYFRQKRTKRFLDNLETVMGIPITELAHQVRGGQPELQSTWVHPRVAIHLAAWLSLEFETFVTGWVEEFFRRQGELRGALKEWIAPNLQPWTLMFPPEFYGEIYRLKEWVGPLGPQKPSVIGHYTNDIVYARLTPGLLETLRINNPRQVGGDLKDRHHQWLTDHKGYPKLKEHLKGVVYLMQSSDTWKEFMVALDRVAPVFTPQLSLFEVQKAQPELWGGA